MQNEFKTIWELNQSGSLNQISETIHNFVNGTYEISSPILGIENDLLLSQLIITIAAGIIIGFTFLPIGATPTSIQACQVNTDKKLLKTGGALIVITTSISAILFLQVLKLNQMLGNS